MTDDKEQNANSQASDKPSPIVLSIVICDTIIRDEQTKKISLIGLFNAIRTDSFPCTHNQMHVYVALTEGHGKYKTEIRFIEAGGEVPIAGIVGELNFTSPLQIAELNTCWQKLHFKKPGEYIVEILCDGKPVGSRKFIVSKIDDAAPGTGPDMRK